MEVYIILEHQLDCNNNIVGTQIAQVCSTLAEAEEKKEDWEFADAHTVENLGGDPCRYEIVKHKVI